MHSTAPLRAFFEKQLPSALEMLREMVGINSFTLNPTGVNQLGRYTAECFAPLGFTAETVPSTNPLFGDHLILNRPGSSPANIALISHLDTVYSPEEEARNDFRWHVEGDRIYGPGTNDIKGGSIMIWLILTALREFHPEVFERITWQLLWNSSEEDTSPDFGDVCRERFDADTRAALVFECEGRFGDEQLMVVSRKGRATWRVRVAGRAAHAGSKLDHGVNAIVQLGRIVERIHALTDMKRGITFNVAMITGGTALNRVPQEAIAEGELRAFTPETYAEAKAALLALAGEGDIRSSVDRFPAEVVVEIQAESRPWPRNPATDSLADIWRATGADLGVSVGSEARGGLSDGNLIWDAVPTLDGLGPWGDHAHCSERTADGTKLPEYLELSGIIPKAILNTLAILKIAEQP
jgi:glutamate carboxypeptidase